ncbi:MAG: hypothetical protein AB1631_32845 [Acidobacteriota bacterium]
MKRLFAKLGLCVLAIVGLVAANAILLATIAALDVALGVPPQLSAIPALIAFAAILAFAAMRSRATDTRPARAREQSTPAFDPAQSTPAVEGPRATFVSSIIVRRRQNRSATRKERRAYSEASF